MSGNIHGRFYSQFVETVSKLGVQHCSFGFERRLQVTLRPSLVAGAGRVCLVVLLLLMPLQLLLLLLKHHLGWVHRHQVPMQVMAALGAVRAEGAREAALGAALEALVAQHALAPAVALAAARALERVGVRQAGQSVKSTQLHT